MSDSKIKTEVYQSAQDAAVRMFELVGRNIAAAAAPTIHGSEWTVSYRPADPA